MQGLQSPYSEPAPMGPWTEKRTQAERTLAQQVSANNIPGMRTSLAVIFSDSHDAPGYIHLLEEEKLIALAKSITADRVDFRDSQVLRDSGLDHID